MRFANPFDYKWGLNYCRRIDGRNEAWKNPPLTFLTFIMPYIIAFPRKVTAAVASAMVIRHYQGTMRKIISDRIDMHRRI